MDFHAGYSDSYTRDVARLSKSVKKHEPIGFLKVEQHPKCKESEYPAGRNPYGICFIK